MILKPATYRIVFGFIIFLFSLAFAYFTASYLQRAQQVDYWYVLAMASVIYIVIGIMTFKVFSVSLSFLFSSDILLINILFDNYGSFPTIGKAALLGILLVIMYTFAWWKMKDTTPVGAPGQPFNLNNIVPPGI